MNLFYTKNALNLPFGFGLVFAAPCVLSLGIVAAISGSINKNIRYIFGLWPSFICDYHYISSVWKGNHMVIIVIPLLKVAIITENEKVAWFKSLSFFKLITPRVRNEMEVSNSRDFRKFVNSEKLDVHSKTEFLYMYLIFFRQRSTCKLTCIISIEIKKGQS